MTVAKMVPQTFNVLAGTFIIMSLLTPLVVSSSASSPTQPIIIPQTYPGASFTYLPANPIVNQPVAFDASGSTGTIASYTWTFGDGTPSFNNVTAMHTYSTAGTYSVTLKIEDSQRDNSTLSLYVSVSNGLPLASFIWSSRVPAIGQAVGTTVTFDASNSSDPNGRVVSYAWDWGDGTTNGTTTKITNPSINHTYNSAGTYAVALTVTDSLNLTASSSQSLIVKATNVPPIPSFTITPQTTYVGDLVTFNGSSSSDPDGIYPVSLSWQYGDGASQKGNNVTSHAYTASGLFNVTLTATDDSGNSTSLIQRVFVLPKLTVTASPSTANGTPPLHITFIAQASGGQGPYTFQWTFGDGQTAAGQSASHNYTSTGTYIVQAKAIDSAGHIAVSNVTIAVSPVYTGFLPIPYILGGIGIAGTLLISLLIFYAYFLHRARRRDRSRWEPVGPGKNQIEGSPGNSLPRLIRMRSFRRNQNDEV